MHSTQNTSMIVEDQQHLSVSRELYTETGRGGLWKIQLTNKSVGITITNLGCSIVSIETPDRKGVQTNIVAGFANLLEYFENPDYFGCIVGRFANRIAGGKFYLDGKLFQLPVNNAGNHLHGGFSGFHQKLWTVQEQIETNDCVGVVFTYVSNDGEEGYPGNLMVTVSYTLDCRNQLSIGYEAKTDKATPINFTNHSYFNLSGFEQPTIKDHILQVFAESSTEKNSHNLPTGRLLPVWGTPLDFTEPKRIGEGLDAFPLDMGYDHNFVLKESSGEVLAASLVDPLSGRCVRVYTTQPGLQLYTANYWNGAIRGIQGLPYCKHGAVALETQAFPDSPNHARFPNTILRPGEVFSSKTTYEFGVDRKV